MRIQLMVLLFGLGLGLQVQADSRGGVIVYQPNGGSYRVENQAPRYDPRSPYSNHRQYPQNTPPRFQGQLPPQYYERHRGQGQRLNEHRRHEGYRSHSRDGRFRSDMKRPHHGQRHDPRQFHRPAPIRERHGYRVQSQQHFNSRSYQR